MSGTARRALVIASQTGGLRGCHNDADLTGALLRERGFEVNSIRGAAAGRAGILAAFEDLIGATGPDDAVVVYYAGHGSRAWSTAPGVPRELRFIVPTDIDPADGTDFRGILTEELSALQWRLTLRTSNVTTILDCCHASGMSRRPAGGETTVRGWETTWPAAAVARRWTAAAAGFRRLRAEHPDAPWFDANPDAVRLVACGSHELAHERYAPELGNVHGCFTAALMPVLRAEPQITWRAAGERARQRVLAQIGTQRPDAEGPMGRVAFTLDVRRTGPAYPVRTDPPTRRSWLEGAHLHGLRTGDEFLLTPPGGAGTDPGARPARIVGLSGNTALLAADDHAPIADGTIAHTARQTTGTQWVRVATATGPANPANPANPAGEPVPVPAQHGGATRDGRPQTGTPAPAPGWHGGATSGATRDGRTEPGTPGPGAIDVVLAALADVPGIRVRTGAPAGEIATVVVDDGRFMLHDAAGRPLYTTSRAADRDRLQLLCRHITELATTLRLQGLAEADGDLDAPVGLEVSTAAGPLPEGAVLHFDEPVRIAVTNDAGGPGPVQVYANVLDLGVAGRIAVLNQAEPAGIALEPGRRMPIGADPGGYEPGMALFWPEGVPETAPRYESFVAIFSDTPQDLRSLAQEGVVRGEASPLAQELARRLNTDTVTNRDLRAVVRARPATRFTLRRVTFRLCPGGAACAQHP